MISVTERTGLETTACACDRIVKAEFDTLTQPAERT
jgi:hypothetical protein